MAFWEGLAKGSFEGLLSGVGSFAKDIRTAITGKEAISSEQQTEVLRQINALELLALQLETKAAAGQIDLNKLDAQSTSLFKGGWRPALGWCCVLGLMYTFLLKPLLPWGMQISMLIIGKTIVLPPMPALDMKELMALVMALLGFGGFRMYEKIKGVSK